MRRNLFTIELLIAVGEDPDREGLQETPARVTRAYKEVFAGLHADPTEVLHKTFAEEHQDLVLYLCVTAAVVISVGTIGNILVLAHAR